MRGLGKFAATLLWGAAVLSPSIVSAQQFDKSFYLGIGVLGSELEPRVNQSSYRISESQSAGGQLFLGGDLSKHFSIEGYYRFLGEAELTNDIDTGVIEYHTAGVNGLLYLFSSDGNRGLRNRTGFMVYGRAGVGYLDNSSDDLVFSRVQSTHLSSGLGLEYGFENGLGLRAEFLNHDADARDFSFSLFKRFGRTGEVNLTPEPKVEAVPEVPAQIVAEPEAVAVAETSPPPPPPPPPMPNWDKDEDGVLDNDDQCEDTAPGAVVDNSGCAFTGVLEGVTFATGSAELTGTATKVLDEVVNQLIANPKIEIAVQAHTDNKGSARLNMELSRRRAVSVVRYLSDVGGVSLARMSAIGFGESRPVQSNRTASGRQANRRVEIAVK